MSYTFSVNTKNTFVRQATNWACKCTYATSTVHHFIIYMALEVTHNNRSYFVLTF